METLRSAFQLEEENRRPSASAMALAASTSVSANAAVAGSCYYCGKPGHQQTECSLYIKGQKSARAGNNYTSRHKPRNKGKASSHGTSSANQANKSAANASVPPSPDTLSDSWNEDTGATSHMTPHRHWFRTYTPFGTPVRLANGQLIHSTGVGTVQFEPVINGKKGWGAL